MDKFDKATEVVKKSTKLIILIIGSVVAIGCAVTFGINELSNSIPDDETEQVEEYVDENDSTYIDEEAIDDSTYVEESETE